YHGPEIECAVLSPDGTRVASVARYSRHNTQVSDQERQRYDCSIVVWDAASGPRGRTSSPCVHASPGGAIAEQAGRKPTAVVPRPIGLSSSRPVALPRTKPSTPGRHGQKVEPEKSKLGPLRWPSG